MKAYSAYKPAKIEWVGKIPSHWDLMPIRAIFEERKESNLGPKTDFILSVMKDVGVIPYEEKGDVGNKKSDDIERYNVVHPGDLVFNKMNVIIGSVGISNYHGALSPVYIILYPRNPKRNERRFLGYLFKVKPFQKSLRKISSGILEIRESINKNEFKKIYLPLPPFEEQQHIADFLDQKTAEIDEAIAKKQRLIELLEERKAILINKEITNGNHNNDSIEDNRPTPWLFPLPNKWIRKKLKYITYLKGRLGWQNLRTEEYTDEGPYLVSSEHFKNGVIEWDKCNHVNQLRFEMAPEIILREQDVLFMKDGASMGKLAFVGNLPGDACLNSHLLLMRPLNNLYLPKFLFYVAGSTVFTAYMRQERKGATFFGFSQKSMGDFPLSFPPISTQQIIVKYLEKELAKINVIFQKIEQEMKLLRILKTSIISEAVTGKIKI